jgi:hypothetical protein
LLDVAQIDRIAAQQQQQRDYHQHSQYRHSEHNDAQHVLSLHRCAVFIRHPHLKQSPSFISAMGKHNKAKQAPKYTVESDVARVEEVEGKQAVVFHHIRLKTGDLTYHSDKPLVVQLTAKTTCAVIDAQFDYHSVLLMQHIGEMYTPKTSKCAELFGHFSGYTPEALFIEQWGRLKPARRR